MSVARRATVAAIVVFAAAAAAAQAPPPPPVPTTPPTQTAPTAAAAPATDCGQCGKVVSIRQTTEKQPWTPLGSGVGVGGTADLGGGQPNAMTTFQFGPGLSNRELAILGSAGGASYRRKPTSYEKPRWEVTVKLDNGATRVVLLSYEPYVVEGDRVRVSGNNVELVD
jgi:outer membrane lipoprotein SlyB